MRAVCLQHVPFEGPGVFATSLEKRGVTLEYHLVPKDGLPADPGNLLIVLGGPMSVNDSDGWIGEEATFIKSALLADKPVVGICLGSQFMAKAMGATVRAGKRLEIGMTALTLTPDAKSDPVCNTWWNAFDAVEWDGEVFDRPPDCVPLAGSTVSPLQAFRYRGHAYGLLFHIEMDSAGIDARCRECPVDLIRARMTGQSVKTMAIPHLPKLHQFADRLIGYLVDSKR